MMPTFSRWEMAWTSFDSPSTMFEMTPMDNDRFHPTQKPVALYKWLLTRYSKPGQTILDTHGGSGSIAIACHDLGFDLTWMELDKDYFDSAVARYTEHARQGSLFEPEIIRKPEQRELM
jgi:site-specific DNA-methyltransferase (adenine-specific)